MENLDELAKALDRTANPEQYISGMQNDELMAILNAMENLDEVTIALTELSIRDAKIVSPYCLRILEENLGDEFLQAVAFHLLYDSDQEKALNIVNQKLRNIPAAWLGAIMDSLSTDRLQPLGESFTSGFLKSIEGRYREFNDTDKKRILENYEWFKESYEERLK